MLQYFLKQTQPPPAIFKNDMKPHLEYICNVDPDGSRMPRTMHSHEDLVEILLVYHGAGIYMIDGKRYTAKKGDLILYNQNSVHDEFGGTGEALCTYCIAVQGLQRTGYAPGVLVPSHYSPIIHTQEKFSTFFHLYQSIEEEVKTNTPLSYLLANEYAQILLLKTIQLLETNGLPCQKQFSPLMQAGIHFIDMHYRENIRLQDIAAAIPMNPYYLAHIFTEELGISPMKYVNLRRIGEAQNLLINTNMTITQIATEVGYNNSNYFQNTFRNVIKITPGAYRRLWVK